MCKDALHTLADKTRNLLIIMMFMNFQIYSYIEATRSIGAEVNSILTSG